MQDKKNLYKILFVIVVLGIGAVSYYSSRNSPSQDISAPDNNVPQNNNPLPSSTNNTIKGSTGVFYNKSITQAQAEQLVRHTWGDCSTLGCISYVVTVSPGNLVTAIYNIQKGSIYRTQKQATAIYNGTWRLGSTVTKQECWGGTRHADGSDGLSSSPCI